MSCFLLPKTICDEINSTLSEYWWGHNDGRRRIPWVAWNRMSIPKKEGGLGFRDVHSFNKALLGNQAWRLLQNPNSLLARLYRGRYHHRSSFLVSHAPKNASLGWKSIQVGKELLKQGLQTQIGSGQYTMVWRDKWLPTLPPRAPIPKPGILQDINLRVCDLWQSESRHWNHELIDTLFDPADGVLIKQLYVSQFRTRDTLVWPYNKDLCTKYYCSLLFQHKIQSPLYLVGLSYADVQEWMNIITTTSPPSGPGTTVPPPCGFLKCNFDSSYNRDNLFTGTGWIFRDEAGQYISSGYARLPQTTSSLQAETLGFLNALQAAWRQGFTKVWFENDCLSLVQTMNTFQDHREISGMLYDVRCWAAKLPHCSLGYVKREGNMIANQLCKQANFDSTLYNSFTVTPSWMVPLLYADIHH